MKKCMIPFNKVLKLVFCLKSPLDKTERVQINATEATNMLNYSTKKKPRSSICIRIRTLHKLVRSAHASLLKGLLLL